MTRTLNANGTAGVAVTEGVESVVQVQLLFGVGRKYASKDTGVWKGRITAFSGISSEKKSENTANVAAASVQINDFDLELKSILETWGLDGVECIIYQFFDNVSGTTGTEIFRGRVVNPVQYDEATLTVSLNIESIVFSSQLGFLIEEGQYSVNNDVAIGKMWPLVFGKVAHLQALLVQKKPESELVSTIAFGGKPDDTNLHKLGVSTYNGKTYSAFFFHKRYVLEGYEIDFSDTTLLFGSFWVRDAAGFSSGVIKVSVDGVIFKGEFSGDHFNVQEANATKYEDLAVLERPTGEDEYWNKDPKSIYLQDGNSKYLVNHYIYIRREDMPFAAGFDDESEDDLLVRKIVGQDGDRIQIESPILFRSNNKPIFFDSAHTISEVRALAPDGLVIDGLEASRKLLERSRARQERLKIVGSGAESKASGSAVLDALENLKYIKDAFWNKGEGTIVREWGTKSDVYVANAVTSTSVDAVYGFQQIEGEEKTFRAIPSDLYTIGLSTATSIPAGTGPQNITTISFTEPLSTLKDQGWEDDIYVTLTSSLSSNTATAIKWILDNYTSLTTKASSFTTAASELIFFPSNFAITSQKDALALAEDIAWQCRCALIIDGDEIKIKYLSESPSSDLTIAEDDVEFGSIIVQNTSRSEVITRLRAYWQETYDPENEPLEYIYTNNQADYGLIEQDYEIFIYNMQSLVQKTIDFWGNRYSNIWRKITFAGFHTAMKLEVFDTITFTLSTSDILGTNSTKSVVESSRNQVINGVIEFECWLPMVAGTSTEQSAAWTTDTELASPANPANNYHKTNYGIWYESSRIKISVENAISKLKKIGDKTKYLGVVKKKTSSPLDNPTVDIYFHGYNNPPDMIDVSAHILSPTTDVSVGSRVEVNFAEDDTCYVIGLLDQDSYLVAITGFVGMPVWDSTLNTFVEHPQVKLYGHIEVELVERCYRADGTVIEAADLEEECLPGSQRNFSYENVLNGRFGILNWPIDDSNPSHKPAINLPEMHNWNNYPVPAYPTPYYVYLVNINHQLYPQFFNSIPPSANEEGFWNYFYITKLFETVDKNGQLIKYINQNGLHDGTC